MKTQISRDSFRPAEDYSGVHLQQGRMLVDADFNESAEIGKTRLEGGLRHAVASGAPRTVGLALSKAGAAAPVMIRPGALYVDGVPARLAATADVALGAQPRYRHAPAAPAASFHVYADVWERPVTALEDGSLLDAGLHGADTATRTRTMLQVKWCPLAVDPASATANPPVGTGLLWLQLRQIANESDQCDPCAAQVEVDERIGNYLFRVEVHDLFAIPNPRPAEMAAWGAPGERVLMLKWSRDNGAEAYTPDSIPQGFDQGDWAWEFFDSDSENLLGHHFPAGARTRRGELVAPYLRPAAPAPRDYVRQWDGFARINLDARTLIGGRDRGVALSTALGADAHGHVSVGATALTANLELMQLRLTFGARQFVAGDHWLAAVREAEHDSGDDVLGSAAAGEAPRGIVHRYLELGRVDGAGAFVALTDAERRRLNFPPLTDIRAADVGFTNNCAGTFGTAANVQQALDELCNLGAEDIGYAVPACGTAAGAAPTVRSLLATVPGFPDVDGVPRSPSVKDMLDALLCHLNAARLPYDGAATLARWREVLESTTAAAPATVQQAIDALLTQLDSTDIPHTLGACTGSAGVLRTVRELIGAPAGPHSLANLIEALYCNFNAAHLPLNKDLLVCADLRTDAAVVSVQDALDKLCQQAGNGCTISVPAGQLEARLREFQASALQDISLCLLPGTHPIAAALAISGKRSLRISAATPATAVVSLGANVLTLEAAEVVLEGVQMLASSAGHVQLNGARTTAMRCAFTRAGGVQGIVPMVRTGTRTQAVQLTWRDNTMSDTWIRRVGRGSGVLADAAIVGDVRVARAFERLFAEETLFGGEALYEAALAEVVDGISELPLERRIALADVIDRNVAPEAGAAGRTRAVAAKSAAKRAARAAGRATAAVAVGAPLIAVDGRPGVILERPVRNLAVRDELVRNVTVREDLRDAIVGGVVAVLFESGFNIALAISSHRGDAVLEGNRIEGEVLAMNELERAGSGAPAAQVGVDPELTVQRVAAGFAVSAGGRFVCAGNRIERLWCLVPNSAVSAGRLTSAALPGWGSAVLTGNTVRGYGHSAAAAALNVNGNEFANGPPSGPRPIARFFCDYTTFAGNTASFADDFTPVFVSTDRRSVAATLFAVSRFIT